MRRRFIPILLTLAAIVLHANAQNRTAPKSYSDSQILHALQRLTFGPKPGDIEAVRTAGLEQWIQSQLNPEGISENPVLEERLKPLETLSMTPSQLLNFISVTTKTGSLSFVSTVRVGQAPTGALVQMMQQPRNPDMDLRDGKLYRIVYSNRQLEEVLVDFWFNHFNVTTAKGRFVADYEREAIRPFVLGKFKDMLVATALHPAMLQYLDNKSSIAPEISQPNGPNFTRTFEGARGLNENFSRELMELHTLGVDGGYTQKDIEAAARCFTGWFLKTTSAGQTTHEPASIGLFFMEWPHDPKDKVVLGHTIRGSGDREVYELLDILASHSSTALHISRQLAQRFVADNPPQPLIDRMAKTFMDTDGDLRAVMTTMLTSREFLSGETALTKIKSPLELVASAMRAVDANTTDPAALEQWIADMGEPLYSKTEPTGYPNTGESWISTASLFVRLNFAANLVAGKIPGVTLDRTRWKTRDTTAIARSVLGRDPSASTVQELRDGIVTEAVTPAFIAGLILGSPEFQRK
jgi:uncharacterized protein (DUF1800 family)